MKEEKFTVFVKSRITSQMDRDLRAFASTHGITLSTILRDLLLQLLSGKIKVQNVK